ncbi:hypothetical protein, partial [Aeromonas salmonicida]|uniref:hypothetical protein n=2 Tax=Aeromonas salmonicida TaxID=645 RepID=UPI0031FC89B6
VDMLGVPIVGVDGSAISGNGVMHNTGKVHGVKIAGFSATEHVDGIMPAMLKSGLIIAMYAEKSFYIFSKSPVRKEYVSIRMRSSAADGDGPWDFIREQSAFACELTVAYQSVLPSHGRAIYVGDSWEDFNYTASALMMPPGTNSGSENSFVIGRTVSAQSEYVDITCDCMPDGTFNIAYLQTTGSAGVMDVYVDKGNGLPSVNSDGSTGVTPDATLRTQSKGTRIGTAYLRSYAERASVRIVSRSNNRSYLMGVNFHTPDQADCGIEYDKWAYYRKSTQFAYVANTGAADYAIRDLDSQSGKLVGSYHGSERQLIDPIWIIDGIKNNEFILNKPVAAKDITLHQKTEINGKLTSVSDHSFGDGWIQKIICLSGAMRSDTVYIGMCLPQVVNEGGDCFTELIYPFSLNVKEQGEYPIGGSNLVIWRNPTTEARVFAYHRNFNGYFGKKSQAYIKTAYGITSYSKLYHNLQNGSAGMFNGASSQIIHMYC